MLKTLRSEGRLNGHDSKSRNNCFEDCSRTGVVVLFCRNHETAIMEIIDQVRM